MPSFSKTIVSAFIAFNLALPAVAAGTQFITGPCTSDADCAAGCCGFKTGKCAGAVVALGRDGGCGFGDAQSNNNAAVALGFTGAFTPTTAAGGNAPPAAVSGQAAATSAAPAAASGQATTASAAPAVAAGTQFITGACTSDADCAAGCCGFKSGKCAGAVIALERDGGCGFGNAQSNNNAAVAIGFTGAFTPTTAAGGNAAPAADKQAATAPATQSTPAVAPGTQFITGACKSDADCAAGCCGFKSGKCAGAIIALERDGGCGFGNAQSNNNAAVAIGFTGAFTPTNAAGTRRDTTAMKFPRAQRGIRGGNL